MQENLAAISERFLADHQKLEVLLERLLAAFEGNDRETGLRLWTECASAVAKHLETEERHLIAPLLRINERGARVLVQEHRHLRARLAEFDAKAAPDRLQLGTVRDFIDELRAHGKNEDRLLYEWADAHLDEGERTLAVVALLT